MQLLQPMLNIVNIFFILYIVYSDAVTLGILFICHTKPRYLSHHKQHILFCLLN